MCSIKCTLSILGALLYTDWQNHVSSTVSSFLVSPKFSYNTSRLTSITAISGRDSRTNFVLYLLRDDRIFTSVDTRYAISFLPNGDQLLQTSVCVPPNYTIAYSPVISDVDAAFQLVNTSVLVHDLMCDTTSGI